MFQSESDSESEEEQVSTHSHEEAEVRLVEDGSTGALEPQPDPNLRTAAPESAEAPSGSNASNLYVVGVHRNMHNSNTEAEYSNNVAETGGSNVTAQEHRTDVPSSSASSSPSLLAQSHDTAVPISLHRVTTEASTSSESRLQTYDPSLPSTSGESRSQAENPSLPSTSAEARLIENVAASADNPPLPHLSTSTPVSQGPSASVSQNAPGIAASFSHNTSLDDFQSPVFRGHVVLAAAAVSASESVLEFRSPKRRRLLSPAKTASASTSKGEGASAGGDCDDDEDGNVS